MAASPSGVAFTFVVGLMVDKVGYAPVFWTVGCLALVACLALSFWLGRVERIERSTVQ